MIQLTGGTKSFVGILVWIGLIVISTSMISVSIGSIDRIAVNPTILPTSAEVQDFSVEEIDTDNDGLFDYLELTFKLQSANTGNLSIQYQFFNANQQLFHAHVLAETELISVVGIMNSIKTRLSNSVMYGLSFTGDLTIRFNGRLDYIDGVREHLDPMSFSLGFDSDNYELPPVYVSEALDVTLVNLDQNINLADIINLEIPISATANASIRVSVTSYKLTGDARQTHFARQETFAVTPQTSKIIFPLLAPHFLTHEFFDFDARLKIQLNNGNEYSLLSQSINNVSLPDALLEPFDLLVLTDSGIVTELDRDGNGKIDTIGLNYTVSTTKAINIDFDYEIIDSRSHLIYLGHSNDTIQIEESTDGESISHQITALMNVDGLGSLSQSISDPVEIFIDWSTSYSNYPQLIWQISTSLYFSPTMLDYDPPGTTIVEDSIGLSYIPPVDSLSETYSGLAIDFDVTSKYERPEHHVTIELFGQTGSGDFTRFILTSVLLGGQYLNSDIFHERIEFTSANLRPSQLNYQGLMEINISSQVFLRGTDEASLFFKGDDITLQIEFSLARDPDGSNTGTIPTLTGSSIPIDLFTPTSITYSEFSSSKGGNSDFNLFWIGVGLSALYMGKRTRTPKC